MFCDNAPSTMTRKYTLLRSDTIRCDTIQCNAMQFNTIHMLYRKVSLGSDPTSYGLNVMFAAKLFKMSIFPKNKETKKLKNKIIKKEDKTNLFGDIRIIENAF